MAKYSKIIAVLLMLVFTSQVVASASVSCQNQSAGSQSPAQMMDSDVMDHSQHMNMGESSADAATVLECCPDCDCSLGGCAAAAVPVSEPTLISNLASSMSPYKELTASQLSATLFRPPISR
ncbi:MAG: hypothetical protein V7746_00020 [Halioglobus sp.]